MRQQMVQSNFRPPPICERRAEIGQPMRDWLVQTEDANFQEFHRRKADDWLCHGCQSQARIYAHRYCKRLIAKPTASCAMTTPSSATKTTPPAMRVSLTA